MVKIVVGEKGKGKTKILLESANELAKAWYATDSKYAAKVSWLVPKIQEIA